MTKPFEPDSYDLVYSRDVILHIDDKRRLFEILFVSSCILWTLWERSKPTQQDRLLKWRTLRPITPHTCATWERMLSRACAELPVNRWSFLQKCLKPGGQLFITDYCCGEKEHSEEFKDYVKQRGYNLLTVADYGKV